MAVRGLGCPVRFTLTASQKGDAPQAAALLEGLPAEVVMADTAYDADHLRQAIAAKGALAVIPNNPSRALKYPLDKHLYAQRHLLECCFSKKAAGAGLGCRLSFPGLDAAIAGLASASAGNVLAEPQSSK